MSLHQHDILYCWSASLDISIEETVAGLISYPSTKYPPTKMCSCPFAGEADKPDQSVPI